MQMMQCKNIGTPSLGTLFSLTVGQYPGALANKSSSPFQRPRLSMSLRHTQQKKPSGFKDLYLNCSPHFKHPLSSTATIKPHFNLLKMITIERGQSTSTNVITLSGKLL